METALLVLAFHKGQVMILRHTQLHCSAPDDGIPINTAIHRYHTTSKKIWKLIDAGKVKAGHAERGVSARVHGRLPVLVSASDLHSFVGVPRDAITMVEAASRAHKLYALVKGWVDGGHLVAWSGVRDGHYAKLVSASAVDELVAREPGGTRSRIAGSDPAPDDGEPITKLASDLKITPKTIKRWLKWNPHPALGRKIRRGRGQYMSTSATGRQREIYTGLVSRTDVMTCVEAMRQPIGFQFPGANAGTWVSEGRFKRKDGSHWLMSMCVEDPAGPFGLPDGFVDHRQTGPRRTRLNEIWVPWPTSSGERWLVRAVAEESVENAIKARNDAEAGGGKWVDKDKNQTWRDSDGSCWHSFVYVCNVLGVPLQRYRRIRNSIRLDDLNDPNSIQWKFVPKTRALRNGRLDGGGSVIVYNERDVSVFQGRARIGTGPTTDTGPPTRRRRGRPKGSISISVAQRKLDMLNEWDRGAFGMNKAEAGRAHGFGRSDATKIINAHDAKKCRK